MWFVYALISTFFAGVWSFGQRMSVQKGYDSVLQSALSGLVAALVATVLYLFSPSAHEVIPAWFYGLGVVAGILYVISTIARLEALKFVDSTIHFPLYKVVGPALVAGIGIGLLGDKVSLGELIGIVLSCLVPLLLITKSEHHRQKNLKLGVIFTLIATMLAACTASLNAFVLKGGAFLALPIVIITCFFGFLFGLGLFLRRHEAKDMKKAIMTHMTPPFLSLALGVGIMLALSSYFLLLAISGNPVSLVYSINAHYILIPVLLSVWFYKEHWNKQKAIALVVSLLALMLLHR